MAEPPRPSWFKSVILFWGLRNRGALPRGSPVPAIVAQWLGWLSLWVVIDRGERQPEPVFSPEGIPVLAWYGLGVLALAALLRWRSTPMPTVGAALVLATGLVPVPLLLVTLVANWLEPRGFWWTAFAAALYALLYLSRGLRAVTGSSQRLAALLGVAFIAGFIVLSDMTDAIPDLWEPRGVEQATATAAAGAPSEDGEAALFEQADRIDEALESVRREASPRPQGFFLGFAGVGDQKVFTQEIGLAARVIGERYRTRERQISLINDERDLERAPLASASGLAYALKGLASHMQLDRDVLFLAISSHGSIDPSIEVANSQFPFNALTPDDLADALREAGIEWRVIVISACYAGGFIDALRDARTIVIAAAAADRTSFGCSNDSDLTYFGAAFYRDALPGAASLHAAFERARAAIAERERAEGVTPSQPQAFFGFDLESKLSERAMIAASGVHDPGVQ